MPTVAFHTLGCKVNHYETEAIWQLFKGAGYERVDFDSISDIYVINTCTVTNTGDKKAVKSSGVLFEKILTLLFVSRAAMRKHRLRKFWKFRESILSSALKIGRKFLILLRSIKRNGSQSTLSKTL